MLREMSQKQPKDPMEAKRFQSLKMVVSTLIFAESFVEDILNMAQIQNGVFRLINQAFNPQEVLDFVLGTFEPVLKDTGVLLVIKIVKDLKMPEHDDNQIDADDSRILLLAPRS